ncbi:Signal transduction histidine-protein kinase BarA [bioreactor metagenome]|uniref:Signal transduction histidine-protein kinase BarA n=1 Tax=bioreactor metagenome TaxID=1076179 RepID=A0A645IZZ8_9ZZZZ
MLARQPMDVVLTDVWMPEMDGAELAWRIHAVPGMEQLPVIAVTADVASSENFDTVCFNGIVTKPVTMEKLREVLLQTVR